MAQAELAGATVEVTDEGYLTDAAQWTKEIGNAIAGELNIEMTDEHWAVIDFLQNYAKENGGLPTIRRLAKQGGVSTKDFYRLFPGGPLKNSAKIAGLPKPASCI